MELFCVDFFGIFLCLRSACLRASTIQAGAQRQPGMWHRNIHLACTLPLEEAEEVSQAQLKGFPGTTSSFLVWGEAIPSAGCGEQGGAQRSVPEHVSSLAQKLNPLPEVLCSISKLGSGCSCGVQTSARCVPRNTGAACPK